jgi:GNAT superfamily N-acetyltransferase
VGTASFMVAPAARGRGVGRVLGEHVVAWHRSQGYRAIQFNAVVETNTAAVRLWTSLGFEVVGTVPGAFRHPVHGYVGLHVMHLPLVDPPQVADQPVSRPAAGRPAPPGPPTRRP